jgi:predicted nucleic acid-binding Zn ribbon protein
VLEGVLDKHGVTKQIERIGILDMWPEIVGQQLAEVTRAKGVEESALFVEVRSSAWLTELSMMKDEFLERVNDRLGDAAVERIVFVLAETT